VAAEEERERAAAKKGEAVLGVRVIRATAPAPPADSLRLTESKRGRFLEGKGGSVLARARARMWCKGSGRAAEWGHGQRQSSRPAGKKNKGGSGTGGRRKGERRR
jgi:hypothetical protein